MPWRFIETNGNALAFDRFAAYPGVLIVCVPWRLIGFAQYPDVLIGLRRNALALIVLQQCP
jgi:hypothetical protein